MVYVGVLASLLKIDVALINDALNFHFMGNQKAVESNFQVVKLAFEWAETNLEEERPLYSRPDERYERGIQ